MAVQLDLNLCAWGNKGVGFEAHSVDADVKQTRVLKILLFFHKKQNRKVAGFPVVITSFKFYHHTLQPGLHVDPVCRILKNIDI